MLNAIYSGSGEYDGSTLMATYSAYLPDLPEDSAYEFNTGVVYNISCKVYPNRILIFMRVKDGANLDLATLTSDGNTTDTPKTIMFSLQPNFVQDINDKCTALKTDQDIDLFLFHDQYYDVSYVEKNLFCKPATDFETPPKPDEDESNLESPVIIIPKKGKPGKLVIKSIVKL